MKINSSYLDVVLSGIFFVVFFFIYINFNKMWGLYSNVKHESVALNQENSRLWGVCKNKDSGCVRRVNSRVFSRIVDV